MHMISLICIVQETFFQLLYMALLVPLVENDTFLDPGRCMSCHCLISDALFSNEVFNLKKKTTELIDL